MTLPAVGTNDLVPSGSSFPSGENHCDAHRVTKLNPNVGRISKSCPKNEITSRSVASAQPYPIGFPPPVTAALSST